MHGLANYAAERKPDELDSVLNNMAGAAAQMSPEMLLTPDDRSTAAAGRRRARAWTSPASCSRA